MHQELQTDYQNHVARNRRKRFLKKAVSIMGCLVVFCTTYALILPAITMENKAYCGMEEHTHTEACYTQTSANVLVCSADDYVVHTHEAGCFGENGVVLCGQADYLVHSHDTLCYDANGVLVCTLPERQAHVHGENCYVPGETQPPVAHVHSESCYVSQQGALICETEEYEGHTHGSDCYAVSDQLRCALAENHVHQADCYTYPLLCNQSTEPHVHGDGCYGTGNLLCSTQEGHVHSDGCWNTVLACSSQEEGHEHGGDCYTTTLVCSIPENHAHGSSCYESVVICGREAGQAHSHDSSCYSAEAVLICETPENHVHDASCYHQTLICSVPEDPGHTHGDDCYQWNDVLACGLEEGEPEPTEPAEPVLICTEPTALSHVHTETCFELVQQENTPKCGLDHEHTEECYDLCCGLTEHTHNMACWSDPEADVESPSVWEATFAHVQLTGNWNEDVIAIAKTQLGYMESTRNYTVWEDDSIHGYTRYGAWYGVPHGDWCGMFASFCIYYADIQGMPLNYGVRPWIEDLTALKLYHSAEVYEPKTGDLIFYDWEGDGLSDHVGLVAEVIPATAYESAKVKAIEGNSSNCVQYVSYDLGDDVILGYSELPVNEERYLCGNTAHVHNEYCAGGCSRTEHIHTDDCLTAPTVYYCGLEEHTHTDECLDEEGNLICGLQEHSHEDSCLTQPVTYYCGLEEHTHTDECLDEEGNLVCGLQEHSHEDSCLTQPVTYYCGLEEHTHTDECLDEEGNLVCGMTEHVHTEACTVQPPVYYCGLEEHTHTDECLDEEGNLICGFEEHIHTDACTQKPVNYCGLEEHTHTETCYNEAGELICQLTEHIHSEACRTEPPVELTAETQNYIVTVTYEPGLELPEGAEFRVMEYEKDSEIFRKRCEEAGYELDWLLNIGFYLGEEELDVSSDFHVVVTSKQGQTVNSAITHFAESGIENLEAEPLLEGVEEGQRAVAFSSTSFSDFGGMTVADVAEDGLIYSFQVLDINESLVAGERYVVYHRMLNPSNLVRFLADAQTNSTQTFDLLAMFDSTAYYDFLYTGGKTWKIFESRLNAANAKGLNYIWTAEKSPYSNTIRLAKGDEYLYINSTSDNSGNAWRKLRNIGNVNIYLNNTDELYIARVTTNESATGDRNLPHAVHTGSITVDAIRFYNFVENQSGASVEALPGCVYKITGTTAGGQAYENTITSGNNSALVLPANIQPGTYTIEEVSVPDGFMRDSNPVRSFSLARDISGQLAFADNTEPIGIFLNHRITSIESSKRAQVENYAERTYEISLTAKSDLKNYTMDPIDVLFVVDQSNSMLFPSGLVDTGKTVTLSRNNGVTDRRNNTNINRLNALNLDTSRVYFIVADENASSTVYAIWHDGSTWMYQDASFYAKAKHDNADGYEEPDVTVVFAVDGVYKSKVTDTTKANGGGLGYDIGGSTLGKDIDKYGGQRTYKLYTSINEYNRLHYLEQAIANSLYQLSGISNQNRVALMEFTKLIDHSDCTGLKDLTPDNVDSLIDSVHRINTSGGTRQDKALDHAYNTHLTTNEFNKDKAHTFTVLITDGAPVAQGESGETVPDLGYYPNPPAGSIYSRIVNYANDVKKESTLITVGLGMDAVQGGRQLLQDIADNADYSDVLNDASQLMNILNKLLFNSMRLSPAGEQTGDIEDVISDSFYPIARTPRGQGEATGRKLLYSDATYDWILLNPGDWVTLQGDYVGPEKGSNGAGQLVRITHAHTDSCKEGCTLQTGDYAVRWDNQTVSGNGWSGSFFVKAKEDFIGGNAIDTNKQASVAIGDARKYFEDPTVNVHLLDMDERATEVTVYLGDTVNGSASFAAPLDTLKHFFDETSVYKIHNTKNYANVMDKAANLPGLEAETFNLAYAMGRNLTDAEWADLVSGKSVQVAYTYDNDSSHGPVGYFTFTLTKTSDSYASHQTTSACQPGGNPLSENCTTPAETYTLQVTYTAYELGEEGRPEENVHNGPDGPGIQVQKNITTGLNNGQGIVTKNNVHEVHVISGELKVTKKLTEGLAEALSEDTAFTFNLYMDSTSTGEFAAVTGGYQLKNLTANNTGEPTVLSFTVTVPGDADSASVTITNLPRGTYTLTEDSGENYHLDSMTLGTVNCHRDTQENALVFTMGNDPENQNVIGTLAEQVYSEYINPGNGVYGEAEVTNDLQSYEGKVPVEKRWQGVPEDVELPDAVYVMLYETKEGGTSEPVVSNGKYHVLRLDAANTWRGEFTVRLANSTDTVDNHNYTVREVTLLDSEELNCMEAILENPANAAPDAEPTIVYVKDPVEEDNHILYGDHAFRVNYTDETGDNGTVHVVTNTYIWLYKLPKTGGAGVSLYYALGLILCAIAGTWNLYQTTSKKTKKERG